VGAGSPKKARTYRLREKESPTEAPGGVFPGGFFLLHVGRDTQP